MDLLASDSDAKLQVMEFVTSAAKALLGNKPVVFPISSRLAFDAKQSLIDSGSGIQHKDAYKKDVADAKEKLTSSGLQSLESYMKETLDSEQKFKVKMEASSSIGTAILDKYGNFLQAAKSVVNLDTRAVDEINEALERYSERVKQAFGAQYARVDNALLHMLDRADIFFDSNIRITKFTKLMQREELKKEFEAEVIANTTRVVSRQAEAMAEWLTDTASRSISETSAIFARRMGARSMELENITAPGVGGLTCSVSHQMEWVHGEDSVISGLSAAASDLAASYDAINDGQRIASEISTSVRTALTLQTASVGLLSVLAGTASLDVTGITGSGVLATGGLLVLPRQRIALRRELRSRIGTLRKRLQKDLENRVDEHVNTHVTRVRDAMAQFVKFTEDKKRAVDAHLGRLEDARKEIGQVRERIATVGEHGGEIP